MTNKLVKNKPEMSRFGAAFLNQNDSDSSSEEEQTSSEEEEQTQTAAQAKKIRGYGQSSSDDESDGERVIKSGKEKKSEALYKALDDVKKSINNGDFNMMDTNFAKLELEIKKSRDQLFKEGGEKIPSAVLKILELLDDTISEVTASVKKKMSKANATSHNKLKQRFKKYLQSEGEGDMLYEKQLAAWKENPVESEEEKKESDEEDEEEEKEEKEEEEEYYYDEEDEEGEKKEEDEYGAKDQAAEEKGLVDDKDSDDSFWDEPADTGDQDDDAFKPVTIKDIDSKLKSKYAFLFKGRDELTP